MSYDIIRSSPEESKIPEILRIDDYNAIKRRKITKDMLLHRTTILYGSPGAGKSYVIKLCLDAIQHEIPLVFVFSATARENGAYAGMAELVVVKPTIGLIERIIENQKKRLLLFSEINKLDNLKNLYNFCKLNDTRKVIYNECLKFEADIKNILQKTESYILVNKLTEQEIQRLRDEREFNIIREYKKFLHKYRHVFISNYKDTIPSQYFIWLVYIYLNPYVALIFDDCVPFIQELNEKKNHKFTQEMMYTSRWKKLTIIIASQSGKALGPQFRQVIHNTIFCDAPIAQQFSDEIKDKNNKKEFLAIVSKIFSSTNGEVKLASTNAGSVNVKNPTKFIYQVDGNKETKYSFLYELTKESDLKIKLGGNTVNKFCRLLFELGAKMSVENMKESYENVKRNIL